MGRLWGLLLLAVTALAIIGGGAFASGERKLSSVPGEYVVELHRPRADYNQSELEKKLGGKILRNVRPNMIVLKRATHENFLEVSAKLNTLPEVRIAEPNFIFHAIAAPNDPDYAKLWGMNNVGAVDSDGNRGLVGIDVSAEKAWDLTHGSKSVVVAVIDTGVDYTHPELVNNMWTNTPELNGKTGIDDDGNGYIDDIHGYNFVTDTGDPKDDHGHGTHCSGVIGAEGDNGTGVAGVTWNVSIMAIKFLDGDGGGSLENAVRAFDYAIKNNARILSNSWGGSGTSEILKEAVGRTHAAGQLFIAASGNNAGNNDNDDEAIPSTYPFDNILAVAAVDNRGDLAYFSNYGVKRVHVAAPGVQVYSTSKDGTYEYMTGTSMAAPHVSGIAALVLGNEPSMTYMDLKSRILDTARPIKNLQGKVSSGGLADAYYALTGNMPPPDPNDPSIWVEQSAYSMSSEHPYKENSNLSYTIKIPGAKRIALHFAKFETEAGYDKLQFIDASGESLGFWSGNKSDRFSPIIDGDTVVLKFTSDSSLNGYGFDIDGIAVLR